MSTDDPDAEVAATSEDKPKPPGTDDPEHACATPRALHAVIHEAESLLRASDVFKLMTTEGATRLDARARERKEVVKQLRKVDTPNIPHHDSHSQFGDILRLAEAEADAQAKLAKWLKGLAGEKGGQDGKPPASTP